MRKASDILAKVIKAHFLFVVMFPPRPDRRRPAATRVIESFRRKDAYYKCAAAENAFRQILICCPAETAPDDKFNWRKTSALYYMPACTKARFYRQFYLSGYAAKSQSRVVQQNF
jgi:hypothetical protein